MTSRKTACSLVLCAGFMSALIAMSRAEQTAPESAAPIKIAVFDMELEDYSAGGPIAGESPAETARLKLVTGQLRDQLAKSGRYQLVDVSAAHTKEMSDHWLRKCNGCEANIARSLGADQSLLGVFQKVSVMEQTLVFRIRDAQSGALIDQPVIDYRGSTDESWSRASNRLTKHRLLDER